MIDYKLPEGSAALSCRIVWYSAEKSIATANAVVPHDKRCKLIARR